VSKGIDGPQKTCFFFLDPSMLHSELHTFFKADGRVFAGIKNPDLFLHQHRLQQHLGGMLHVKQYSGYPSIFFTGVERGHGAPQ